ncbi:hypothetical protein [Streptomyces sp. NBC_00328]|uniref:hypothetical protein n=1 Tax=Streptomyces sp. NBC_00328 TaxID=2903646 RepID=UPI002E287C43|nr:hypothetical protein [Streptomyces sp. NBC_00328]
MAICFAALFALCALVATVGGIAAITVGWVLPNVRPAVERTRVYGLGVLLFAIGPFVVAVGEATSNDLIQSAGRAVGIGIVAFSTGVVRASQRPAGGDKEDRG